MLLARLWLTRLGAWASRPGDAYNPGSVGVPASCRGSGSPRERNPMLPLEPWSLPDCSPSPFVFCSEDTGSSFLKGLVTPTGTLASCVRWLRSRCVLRTACGGHRLHVCEEVLPLGLELVAVGDEEQVGPQEANYRQGAEYAVHMLRGRTGPEPLQSRTSAGEPRLSRQRPGLSGCTARHTGTCCGIHCLRGWACRRGAVGPTRGASTGPGTTAPRGPA